MTYENFKYKNDVNKSMCQKDNVWHIDSVVYSNSTDCEISIGYHKEIIAISKMISAIMEGNACVSNPSALSNYNFDTVGKKMLVLYHGSHNSILTPLYGRGEDKHDYGKGLYLTPNKELAKEWAVCNGTAGYLYELKMDIDGLEILDFDDLDPLHWVAELMSHREADKSVKYKRLSPIFINRYKKDTSCYDIIKGWRADSSYFSIVKHFVRDELNASLLTEAFKLGDLGIQYCIKSKKAFDRLSIVYHPIEEVNKEIYLNQYNLRDSNSREKLKILLESDKNTMQDVFSNYIK